MIIFYDLTNYKAEKAETEDYFHAVNPSESVSAYGWSRVVGCSLPLNTLERGSKTI